MLPNLIIIGAMKSATSSLHYYLSFHPEIYMSSPKELDFFIAERNWGKGREWYESHFPVDAPVRGESSTNYTRFQLYDGVPKRLHGLLPDAKFIYVLRDPVLRVVSQYDHRVIQGKETGTISEALCDLPNNDYVLTSKYYLQLTKYLEYYDKSRFLILKFEELKNRRIEVLKRVFQFLGVDDTFRCSAFSKHKNRSVDKRPRNALGRALNHVPLKKEVRGVMPPSVVRFYSSMTAAKPETSKRALLTRELRNALISELREDTAQLRAFFGINVETQDSEKRNSSIDASGQTTGTGSTPPLKILLGGVPFGRNNVGDEAILACSVAMFREVFPGALLTVCTNNRVATEQKLRVDTYELLGFPKRHDPQNVMEAIHRHDVFVWCGATGLSDYPEIPLKLMEIAQTAGKKTLLWNVGMNSELNPIKYVAQPGKRRTLLSLITHMTLGVIDAVALDSRRKVTRAKGKIKTYLDASDLIVVRDAEGREELAKCGVCGEVIVGADSALLTEAVPRDSLTLSSEVEAILSSGCKRIAICISAQRAMEQQDILLRYVDGLVAKDENRIVFIPMNSTTDAALMLGLRDAMEHPERAALLEGHREPEEILALLPSMDVVVSSRLHLLILASIVHVPLIGIERGSKFSNFLRPFGMKPVGSVESCSFESLMGETERLLDDKASFVRRSTVVLGESLARLEEAKERLGALLAHPAGGAGAARSIGGSDGN